MSTQTKMAKAFPEPFFNWLIMSSVKMKSSSHFKICFTYELISLTSDKLAFFYGLGVNLEHR